MKHYCKEQLELIDKAISLGFRNKEKENGGFLLPPDRKQQGFLWHYGERGFHDLRRYLKKFNITP